MTATERAARMLRDVLLQKFLDISLGFRVMGNDDSSGTVAFDMKLDNEHDGDEVIEAGGLKMFLDQKSASLLNDYELDYIDGPAPGFVLRRNGTGGLHLSKASGLTDQQGAAGGAG